MQSTYQFALIMATNSTINRRKVSVMDIDGVITQVEVHAKTWVQDRPFAAVVSLNPDHEGAYRVVDIWTGKFVSSLPFEGNAQQVMRNFYNWVLQGHFNKSLAYLKILPKQYEET